MVDTYSNGNLIGSKSVNITLTVPSSIVPSISGANMTETGTGLGIYVQSRSQIKVKITAGGAYGSSITDYSTTFEGVTYKGAEFTTNTISGSGDIDLVVTVKDSRGRTATYTRTASVYAYSKATVSKFEAFRCDASGVAEDGGSYVKITYSFNITPLDNKNGHAVTIQYKRSTATSWTNLTTDGGYSATDKTYLSGAIFDPSYTYDLRIVVQDSFTSDNPQIQIDTESVTVSYLDGGQGMGIGKVAELENTLDVAWLGKFRNGLEVDDMDVVKQEKGQNVQILFEGSGYLGFYNCPQGYLRAPTNGLIPNVQNSSSGSGKLGTSTWKWNTLYAYYGYIDRLMNSLLYNCFVPNNANLNAKRSDGTSRRFLTMLTNNQMYICYDGDTCHFGGDVDIPTYLIANTYRFHSQWIGIYGSHNDAINSTNRKGWIGFDSSKDLTIKNEYNNGYVVLYAGNTSNPGGIKLQSGVNVCYLEGEDVSSPAFRPQAADTGVLYLGVSSAKWRAVYATNGTIQTSDRRVKHDINTLEDRYINLFKLLKPVSYVLNDGKRTHVGFISQDIEEAMQEVGLSDLEFAGFCKDIKQTENDQGKLEDVLDENGNPEYEYSLRYEEFIALNTRMIQDLMKTVEEQNKRIEALEAEIKSIKELK